MHTHGKVVGGLLMDLCGLIKTNIREEGEASAGETQTGCGPGGWLEGLTNKEREGEEWRAE